MREFTDGVTLISTDPIDVRSLEINKNDLPSIKYLETLRHNSMMEIGFMLI